MFKHDTPVSLGEVCHNTHRLLASGGVGEISEIDLTRQFDQGTAVNTIPAWCIRRACSPGDKDGNQTK